MGRDAYLNGMEQGLRDLSLRIEGVRLRLLDSPDGGLKREMLHRLAMMERRRDSIRDMLDALTDEPDGTWADLKAEIDGEWDALVECFEQDVAGLM
ncbi:hypothetical protein [Magnetospirillum sp. UT-4]|uniref:hypothetical protein n=1 Tax=Magnetospirillum sp. UT-4 TaxID=2681467 RepID=UPI00137CFA55|nr:hypothetical protein [Magnetospirillum sp. UT-4]CAA7618844.1 hypothetical protein MTBUT4_30209 [Magnetospirillum sp. UT-4]